MKTHAPVIALGLVIAVLVGGLALLFQRRVATGDVFPAYSSLRADPLGTRALHDSLAQLRDLQVERHFKLLADLEPMPPRTIVLAGVSSRWWTRVSQEEADALDAAVRQGSRLVIALRAEAARTAGEREAAREAEARSAERRAEQERKGARPQSEPVDLSLRWGAAVEERVLLEHGAGAQRSDHERAADLPEEVTWRSDLFFEIDPAAGWRVIYRRAGRSVLVERQLGRGSIVLAGDSYFLSNEALQRKRAPALLAWIVGPHGRVMFDETHLGVTVQPGIAALARRYGLAGAFFTLVLLAGLFVWRRMALFVPPTESSGDVALTYHPAAGLEALLRRSVPANELAAACVAEWKPTARESEHARAEGALSSMPKGASAAARYNAIVRALRRR